MKNKIFVIAEVGINHNGSIILAKKLIDAAVNVGADAVKFQTFDTESEMSIDTKKLVYQKVKINNNLSLYSYTKKLEFNKKNFQILMFKKVNVYALINQIFSLINKVFLNLLYIFLKFFFFLILKLVLTFHFQL